MFEVKLPKGLLDCPDYWQNFIREMHRSGKLMDGEHVSAVLPEFNATLLSRVYTSDLISELLKETHALIFDTEEDYLFFKLKFS